VDAALPMPPAGAAVLSQTLTSDAALEEQAKTSKFRWKGCPGATRARRASQQCAGFLTPWLP
jgi:hypothetical protein